MDEITIETTKESMEEDPISQNSLETKPQPLEIVISSSNQETPMVEEEQETFVQKNVEPEPEHEPIEVSVSWVLPNPDEASSLQNLKIDVLNSEEEIQNQLITQTEQLNSEQVQNQLIIQTELLNSEQVQTPLANQMEAYVEAENNALNTDLTSYFTTDQVFETRLELTNWCQEVGRKVGTVVVITKSEHSIKGRKPRLFLGCERGGVFRDHKKKADLVGRRIRRTGTKRCGCPFVLKGLKLNEGDKWKVEVKCGIHNHPISPTSVGHSYAGRLSKEEKQLVIDMSMSGVRPKEVLTTIRERNKESVSTMTTIYNARAKLRTPNLEGKTAMQHLMKLLLKNRYYEWHRKSEESGEVKDLFWAHPESIQLARCFPSVLMIDCSYKINRFKIPLFEILGTTSTGKTFSIAFFFVEEENEDNYLWAMYRLRNIFDPKSLPRVFVTDRELALMKTITTVFPCSCQLICTLHISRNIVTHCKKYFDTDQEFDKFLDEWTNLIKSESQIDFVDRLAAFEITWANFPDCLTYLKENWLSHYKEYFVAAWTSLVKHHGNTTINRTDSGYSSTELVKHHGNTTINQTDSVHSKLKIYLTSSQGNLTTIWNIMQNTINGEIADVKASFQKSLTTVQLPHQVDPLNELRGFISHMALDLIVEEISRSQSTGIDELACRCVLRHSHGLPCAHKIAEFTNEGRPIPLSSIDSHWKWLSSIPPAEIYTELDYKPEYQELVRRWEESNEEQRMHLLKKIKELADPATTWLNEPISLNGENVKPTKISRNSLSTC